jgi:hypothetical protein
VLWIRIPWAKRSGWGGSFFGDESLRGLFFEEEEEEVDGEGLDGGEDGELLGMGF